jgi:nucleoside-diphosphate-sugar epimerase
VKRFLITGSAGFIGRALARRLADLHGANQVLGVGRQFDLEDSARADALFGGHGDFDYIVHLADVQGNATWSAAHAASQFMRNMAISWNVLRCWKVFQPNARLVTASSLWAYPESIDVADEDHYWSGRMHVPTEHYGLGKKIMSMGIEAHKREYGMHGTTLVFGSVYGPGDHSTHVIPSLIRRMAESPTRLEILGDGSEQRQFIYIDDQIEGIIRHLDYDGDLLNVVTNQSHSIRDVVRILIALVGYTGEVVFGRNAADATFRRLDSRRAERISGWPADVSFVSLEDGLAKTVAALTSARG